MPSTPSGQSPEDIPRLLDRHRALMDAAGTILAEAKLIEDELERRLPEGDPALLQIMMGKGKVN